MQITSIETQKYNKKRISVFIDGVYSFSLLEEDYFRLGLYEGVEILQDDIDRIKNVINFNTAKNCGVRYIALKIRSSYEVEQKLVSEGFDQEVVTSVVEELKSMGYINDSLYAHKFINDRRSLKPQSKKLLKYELTKKGIDEGIIDNVMSEFELDEYSLALRLAKRKYGKYDVTSDATKRRVSAFLARRGFDPQIITSVLSKLSQDSS